MRHFVQPDAEITLKFKPWSRTRQFEVHYLAALPAFREFLALQQSDKMALAMITVEDTVNAAFRNDLARGPILG